MGVGGSEGHENNNVVTGDVPQHVVLFSTKEFYCFVPLSMGDANE